MAHWLLKTEPTEYSYFDLARAGRDAWDGVKNPVARKHIGSMKPGDQAFIYHTGREKAVAGVAEVVSYPYPDPRDSSLLAVDVSPLYPLGKPVTLSDVKKEPAFAGWELVRMPRLSVMPVSDENWAKVLEMGGG